jgi:ComF family protein
MHRKCYGFEGAYSMGIYLPSRSDPGSKGWNDLLSKHIRGLKKYPRYSVPLGLGLTLCINNIFTDLQKMDLIVPVPKFSTELKVSADGENKTYNQAMEVSKIININTGTPFADALKKVRAQKMKGLSEDERWAVVKGLYQINKDIDVDGKKIILLDDVFTTGATVSECSSILLQNGAQNVKVLVAGRDYNNGV